MFPAMREQIEVQFMYRYGVVYVQLYTAFRFAFYACSRKIIANYFSPLQNKSENGVSSQAKIICFSRISREGSIES